MATTVREIKSPAEVPEKIGKYVIINKVGKGSTGTVFLSHDPYYRRDVAIKVYNGEEDQDPERARVARKMFFNEAHMVGMLQHPNIMPIYDAGDEDGSYYVVTEHVQGARTLAASMRCSTPVDTLRVPIAPPPSTASSAGINNRVTHRLTNIPVPAINPSSARPSKSVSMKAKKAKAVVIAHSTRAPPTSLAVPAIASS